MRGLHRIEGSPFEAGRRLGRLGRNAMERFVLPSAPWREVTAPAHHDDVARMAERTRALFPAVMQEIEGLAAGLGLPFASVFGWQCRGELLGAATEGCTTVMIPGVEPCIAHNEDGPPPLRDNCFTIEYSPADGSAALNAFCYPGSIPGTAFGWTEAGLVQTVNNIRLVGVAPEIPRAVLARASLAQPSLAAAVELLRGAPASAGFHFALADCRQRRIVSVEFGGGRSSVRALEVPEVHANHLNRPGEMGLPHIVTQSSSDRQIRASALLRENAGEAIAVLRDAGGPGLPIFRTDPADPDDENTICTALFKLHDAVIDWSIYSWNSETPSFYGRTSTCK